MNVKRLLPEARCRVSVEYISLAGGNVLCHASRTPLQIKTFVGALVQIYTRCSYLIKHARRKANLLLAIVSTVPKLRLQRSQIRLTD